MNQAILNKGQQEFYELTFKFLRSELEEKMLALHGYAGTGKTFAISRTIEDLLVKYPEGKIAITAPTNKAVKVLRDNFEVDSSRIEFLTIHKLFNLKPIINEHGEQIFQAELFSEKRIEEFKTLIVDESSMLPDRLFHEINNQESAKVIFMGDPAQIPPIGMKNSIPTDNKRFQEYNIKCIELTEIMRQASDNPIINLSFMIRQNLTKDFSGKLFNSRLDENRHGVEIFQNSEKERTDKLLADLSVLFNSDKFKEDSDYAKVIAWKNDTVDSYNRKIRKMIYSQSIQKINIGEKLIADEPITEKMPDGSTKILFTTNDEFEVESYEIGTFKELKCYICKVFFMSRQGKKIIKTIRIIHEDNEPHLRNKLREIEQKAKNSKDVGTKKTLWKWYYETKAWFAAINYNYAITAHKAQGSTYQNTIVAMNDIVLNRNVVERNRILYTAFTRPKTYLGIIV
jgi:exodeoxyribonuclease-5